MKKALDYLKEHPMVEHANFRIRYSGFKGLMSWPKKLESRNNYGFTNSAYLHTLKIIQLKPVDRLMGEPQIDTRRYEND